MDTKEQAKHLYLHTDKTQLEIASLLEVNRKTLYLWIKHGKWEEMRKAALQGPGFLIQNIYNYLDMIDDVIYSRPAEGRCPTAQEVNMIGKLIRAATQVEEHQIGARVQSYEEFMRFLNIEDRDLMLKVLPHMDSFVKDYLQKTRDHITETIKQNVRDVRATMKRRKAEEEEELSSAQGSPSDSNEDSPLDNTGSGKWGTVGHDGAVGQPEQKQPEPAADKPYNENDNIVMPQNTPHKNFPENGASPENSAPETTAKPSAKPLQITKEIHKEFRDLTCINNVSITDVVNVNGTRVNLMWFQYCMYRMDLSPDTSDLPTEKEFLKEYEKEVGPIRKAS